MGTTSRTIKRSLNKLCQLGLLGEMPSELRDGLRVKPYDVRGLVKVLGKLRAETTPIADDDDGEKAFELTDGNVPVRLDSQSVSQG